MRIIYYLSAILVVVWIESIEAIPTPQQNTTTDSSVEKSRQLVINSNVPTAATGLNNGNPSSQLQTLNIMQQVTKSGNSPLAFAAELEAQQQEALQLQNQNKQQGLLAAVQTQQDQVNTVQAAITNQSHMVNGHQTYGGISLSTLNPATQQLQQQLDIQKQQLLLQQQLLKQQIKPESQQMTPQQILLTQLLREPASKRPQLLEQIQQTQTKLQAANLMNPTATNLQRPSATQTIRGQQELERYKTLIQLLAMANQGGNPNLDPTRAAMPANPIPMMSDGAILAAQLQQVQQLLMLRRQQQQQMEQMMMFQQQLAMMNPFMMF